MTNIFDYVVPLNNVAEIAGVIHDYVHGDRSKLRWLINFSIHPADPTAEIPTTYTAPPKEPANKPPKTKSQPSHMQLPFDEEEN